MRRKMKTERREGRRKEENSVMSREGEKQLTGTGEKEARASVLL